MRKTHNRLTDDEVLQIFYLKNTEKFSHPLDLIFSAILIPDLLEQLTNN